VNDVHEYEDDPSCAQESEQHWKDLKQRFKTLSDVLKKVGQDDPVKRAQNTMDSITERYGLSENKEKGASASALPFRCVEIIPRREGLANDIAISNITQQHSALEISSRYAELWKEHLDAVTREKGDLVAAYFITYQFRIDQNQNRCRMIEQLQREGLIHWDSLFPNGGNHATVRRNVEAFDQDLYSAWKRGRAGEDTDKEARKREYRSFLRDRERNWGEEYSKWLARNETGKAVQVERD
jgi:hypothetical protein